MRIISISEDGEFISALSDFCRQNNFLYMPFSNDVITLNHLSFFQPDYIICDYTSLSYMTFDIFLDVFRSFDSTFQRLVVAAPSWDFPISAEDGYHILNKSQKIPEQLLWMKASEAEPQAPPPINSISSRDENIHFFRSDPRVKQTQIDSAYVIQIFQCMQSINSSLLAAKEKELLASIDMLFAALNQSGNYKYCTRVLLRLNSILDAAYTGHCHMEPPKHLSISMFQVISDALRYYKHQFLDLSNLLSAKKLAVSNSIYEIMNYINRHYMSDLTLESISSIFHFNPSYLSSKFKRETMLKLVDYINQTRIYLASQLLAVTNVRVSVIAGMAGYSNAKYFFRVFKKQFDLSPSEYRKRCSANYDLNPDERWERLP